MDADGWLEDLCSFQWPIHILNRRNLHCPFSQFDYPSDQNEPVFIGEEYRKRSVVHLGYFLTSLAFGLHGSINVVLLSGVELRAERVKLARIDNAIGISASENAGNLVIPEAMSEF